jgi:transposase
MKKEIKPNEIKKIHSIKKTTTNKRVHNRAMTLLLVDKGQSVAEIARLEILSQSAVKNVISRYHEGGVERAVFDKARSGRPSLISSSDKQRIAAKACSQAPEGRARWTIELLTEEVRRDNKIPTVSRETVRQSLHSHDVKPWLEKMWCVPVLDEEYIRRMEDVLDLYERPYDSKKPVICLDEKPIQLLDDKRSPISAKVGDGVKKVDYEYERMGTANVFRAIEPLIGRHFTEVTGQRKKVDFAEFVKGIADSYPKATIIRLVMDNLNTHNESSLIERYGKDIGATIWSRFEVHYTPKHASWLNQAEIGIGIYSRQCLGKDRIPTIEELASRSRAWNEHANREKITIDWTFTTKKARTKFKYGAHQ